MTVAEVLTGGLPYSLKPQDPLVRLLGPFCSLPKFLVRAVAGKVAGQGAEARCSGRAPEAQPVPGAWRCAPQLVCLTFKSVDLTAFFLSVVDFAMELRDDAHMSLAGEPPQGGSYVPSNHFLGCYTP